MIDPRPLCEAIRLERRYGRVTCCVRELEMPRGPASTDDALLGILDQFVRSLDLTPIGDDWVEIERSVAIDAVRYVLMRDLAYRCPIVPEARAGALAEAFVSLFAAAARFHTNSDPPLTAAMSARGWTPLTAATFDVGIVAYDGARIGIVCVEDED
jgi:hypothetical protein